MDLFSQLALIKFGSLTQHLRWIDLVGCSSKDEDYRVEYDRDLHFALSNY
jgi:hypothetical protein